MEYETIIWKSESTSMASAMVGRVMNTLLNARPKKLENAVVRLGEAPHNSVEGSDIGETNLTIRYSDVLNYNFYIYCDIIWLILAGGSLEESLRFLNKFVKEAVEEKQSLDEVLVPMIENVIKSIVIKVEILHLLCFCVFFLTGT